MKSAAGNSLSRTLEIVFFVVLLAAEVAFMMGGWWVWLEYSRTHA